jgi:hypothetical protein
LLKYAKTLLMALGGTSRRRSALCHLIMGDGRRLDAMPDALPSAAAHYRALALDVYAAAKLIEDPHNRRIMERVALGYENLAARAEARVRTAELVASLTPDDKPA